MSVLSQSWYLILAMGALLFASAFFSSAETALFSLRKSEVRRMGRAGHRIAALLEDSRTLLTTILLGNLLVNVGYFTFATTLAGRFHRSGSTLGMVLTPTFALVGIILFGEVIPKTLAVRRPRGVARFVAPLLQMFRVALAPARVVLGGIASGLGRLVVTEEEEGDLSAAELSALLDIAGSEGQIGGDELETLQGVLSLGEMQIREIMIPRVQMSVYPIDGDLDGFLELVASCRHNKIPIYEDSRDHIIGYVDAKDILGDPGASLRGHMRPVQFVPEHAQVAQVMERFIEARPRLLIVVDEYGGTEGLVTHEDLVEAVVGDLMDEAEDSTPLVVARGDGSYDVGAQLGVRRMARLLGRRIGRLPVSTMGGLVTMLLQRHPRSGDEVETGRLRIRVLSVRQFRPHRLRVSLREHESVEEAAP